MKTVSVVLILLAAVASDVSATKEPAPPVSATSVNGVWEADTIEGIRVFRMDLRSTDRDSYLAVALLSFPPIVARLEHKVIENGAVSLLFRDLNGDYVFFIEASGVAVDDSGVLTGTVTMKRDGHAVNSWAARFSKWKASYIQTIAELARCAAEAIDRVREKPQ